MGLKHIVEDVAGQQLLITPLRMLSPRLTSPNSAAVGGLRDVLWPAIQA